MPSALQLFSEDGTVQPGLQHLQVLLNDSGYRGSINTVSIIGCQSSGKSTLLNETFGTSMQTMSAQSGRQQTTQGIWADVPRGSLDGPGPPSVFPGLLLLDVEGNDGTSNTDKGLAEQFALLTIALSDVVIFNMWFHDVGRYRGANYSLLTNLFASHLKLSTNGRDAGKTVLLIVLRDCDDDCPPEEIQDSLLRDIESIWSKIPKTPELSPKQLSDFFEVGFVFLPHFIYCRDQFDRDVRALRARFLDPTVPDFLLKQPALRALLPESASQYISQMWETIKSRKELHMPSQRALIEAYRCDAARLVALEGAQASMDGWRGRIRNAIVNRFGAQASLILAAALALYDSETQSFNGSPVWLAKRDELRETVLRQLSELVRAQAPHARSLCIERFHERLNGLESVLAIVEQGQTIILEQLNSLRVLVQALIPEEAASMLHTLVDTEVNLASKTMSEVLEKRKEDLSITRVRSNTLPAGVPLHDPKPPANFSLTIPALFFIGFWLAFEVRPQDHFMNLLRRDRPS